MSKPYKTLKLKLDFPTRESYEEMYPLIKALLAAVFDPKPHPEAGAGE